MINQVVSEVGSVSYRLELRQFSTSEQPTINSINLGGQKCL